MLIQCTYRYPHLVPHFHLHSTDPTYITVNILGLVFWGFSQFKHSVSFDLISFCLCKTTVKNKTKICKSENTCWRPTGFPPEGNIFLWIPKQLSSFAVDRRIIEGTNQIDVNQGEKDYCVQIPLFPSPFFGHFVTLYSRAPIKVYGSAW